MALILRSPRAKADVLVAARYIAEQSQSRDVAYRFIDTLDEKLKLLACHREMGESRPDLGPNPRGFPAGQHVIFYRPLHDGIEVVRLLHGSRDIPRIFRTGEQ